MRQYCLQGKLYLLNTTILQICLTVFPWAEFRQKGTLLYSFWSNQRLRSSAMVPSLSISAMTLSN